MPHEVAWKVNIDLKFWTVYNYTFQDHNELSVYCAVIYVYKGLIKFDNRHDKKHTILFKKKRKTCYAEHPTKRGQTAKHTAAPGTLKSVCDYFKEIWSPSAK